jgi:hypothetical protein
MQDKYEIQLSEYTRERNIDLSIFLLFFLQGSRFLNKNQTKSNKNSFLHFYFSEKTNYYI